MKYLGKTQVYDITVDQDHEFYANDILVHNCHRYRINTYWKKHIIR